MTELRNGDNNKQRRVTEILNIIPRKQEPAGPLVNLNVEAKFPCSRPGSTGAPEVSDQKQVRSDAGQTGSRSGPEVGQRSACAYDADISSVS